MGGDKVESETVKVESETVSIQTDDVNSSDADRWGCTYRKYLSSNDSLLHYTIDFVWK